MATNDPNICERVWTVGHSSRDREQFLELVQSQSIELIADVRRYAGSRKHPHFNAEPMAAWLAEEGIAYLALPELGGRRKANPDSPHTVWRNAAFRGYADFMDTAEFRSALERVKHSARTKRTALMCSEAVWWRCHRSMIADGLKAQHLRVLHIMAPGKVVEHPYTAAARIIDGRLTYGANAD